MKSFRGEDVPQPLPAQLTELADGRLLVRHAAGLALFGGVELERVEALRARIDGRSNLETLYQDLASQLEVPAVDRLLSLFEGVLWNVEPQDAGAVRARSARAKAAWAETGAAPRHESSVLVIGNGTIARRVAKALDASCLEDPNEGPWREALAGCSLLICALEDTAYTTLIEIQRRCMRASIASLFITFDADGIRLGPTTVPGQGLCVACAQVGGLHGTGAAPRDLLAAVTRFRTGRASASASEPLVRELVREAHAILALAAGGSAKGAAPQLLTSTLLLGPNGRTRYPAEPVPDCDVCSGLDPAELTTPAALSAAVQQQRLANARRAPRQATPTSSTATSNTATSKDRLGHRIGIVGGGTAGYLTALALRRKRPELDITLIESSRLPIIGVGEATTPLMPQFLHVDLGLDIAELYREVRPTLKLGIRFAWGAPEGCFNYPFGPIHVLEPAVYDGDLLRGSPQSLLMAAGAVAVEGREASPPRSHLDVDVAYHLDNQPFVHYLRRKAAERGIAWVDALVRDVELDGNGENVTALVTEDGQRLTYDLYVDCSGFRALLIEKALGSPFKSFESSLYADRALVASVPNHGVVQPYTLAETMNAGWCWSTPQRHEDHRGYVFSSAFLSPEEAEREMRSSNPEMGDARLIPFRTGRHEHFWRGNVVAMGNAYGFVEPLESTALHMLIRQIGLLLSAFPLRYSAQHGDQCVIERGLPRLLNRRVGAYWDYLRWFLALHYRFNHRLDTPFWRHCREHVDISHHAELVDAFRERGPLSYDPALLRSFEAPDPLWGAEGIDVLLMGQRVPSHLPKPRLGRTGWRQRARLFEDATRQMLPQAQALELLDREPELLHDWARAFERFGPAFP
ncbi:MAG: tryptophan halogenase family protein [Acidobacteriota bacterium]